jgi:HEAT repeat protein
MEVQMKVMKQIPGTGSEEIKKALPAILAALTYDDEGVKHNALSGLYEISRRPDGAALLRDYIGPIGEVLMTSPQSETQGGVVVIFGNLTPPPPEVIPVLLRFLEQTSRDSNAQGGAVFELLKIAPEDPEVIAAIQEFLSRPLDGHTRIGLLNALGNPHVKDARLIAVLTASLDEPDEGVAPAAIQALTRIGRPALEQAEPVLRRLANSPSRPNEVTDQAKQALQTLDALKKGKRTP